jgi:serine phosphatase RsbU (regulator of sigma subunit)
MVLLLTDGVYEPLAPLRDRPAAEIVDAIYEAARAWRRPLPQDDDITLIVVKVQPEV